MVGERTRAVPHSHTQPPRRTTLHYTATFEGWILSRCFFDTHSHTPIIIRHTTSPTHTLILKPPSQYGKTALDCAKAEGHRDIVALLEAAMAAQTKVSQHITLTLPGCTTTNIGTVVHRCTLCMDQTN